MGKRASAQDVARLAGVPHRTAIFALHNVPGVRISDDARRRVLDAAGELDYVVLTASEIQKKVPKRHRTIALIERRSVTYCYADASFCQMLLGAHHAAENFGFEIFSIAVPPGDGTKKLKTLLRRLRPAGAVLSSPRANDLDLIYQLAAAHPVVVQGYLPDCDQLAVRVNDYEAGKAATDHLLRLGHVNVGALMHAPLICPESSERLRGCADSLLEHDLELSPDMMVYAEFTAESGEKQLNELMGSMPKPTAIFASSDAVALGAMKAAREMDVLIPNELALVGFGDLPAAEHSEPPLTTLRRPSFAIGWMVIDMLVRRIGGREMVESDIILPSELIVRQSCGALSTDPIDSQVKVGMLH